MAADIPAAVAESSLDILGITIRCAVLDDGRRVIHAADVGRLFHAMATRDMTEEDATRLANFIQGRQV